VAGENQLREIIILEILLQVVLGQEDLFREKTTMLMVKKYPRNLEHMIVWMITLKMKYSF
jgi:hypothetical protein